MEEEKEIYGVLETSERKDKWILWQVEDLVAQRWSSVFCSPTKQVIVREMVRMLEERKAEKKEFRVMIIGVVEGESLLDVKEMVLL